MRQIHALIASFANLGSEARLVQTRFRLQTRGWLLDRWVAGCNSHGKKFAF